MNERIAKGLITLMSKCPLTHHKQEQNYFSTRLKLMYSITSISQKKYYQSTVLVRFAAKRI